MIEPHCYTSKCQDLELGFDSGRHSCRLKRLCPGIGEREAPTKIWMTSIDLSVSLDQSVFAALSRCNKSVSGLNRHDATSIVAFILIKQILREKTAQ